MNLDDSVIKIKGVGEKTAKLLEKLGIRTVEELIFYYPRDYDKRPLPAKIKALKIGEYSSFVAKIKTITNKKYRKVQITEVELFDDTKTIKISFFNQAYLASSFKKNTYYIFFGMLNDRKDFLVRDYEVYNQKSLGEILPIYPLTKGLGQKKLRKIISEALNDYLCLIEENLPSFVLDKQDLMDRKMAVKNLHFPKEELEEARKRAIFEDFFILQLNLSKMKTFRLKNKAYKNMDYSEVLELIDFKLTKSQEKVLADIKNDFSSGYAMNRLIQGDVGSGKTILSLISSYISIKSNKQVALMAPTDVLARQHFESYKKIFDKLGIKTSLLSGTMKEKEKKEVLAAVKSGESQMIIGTHALIQKSVEYKSLGLVICDEQHRFGVNQRKTLAEKGENPHKLIMSATPIPRTLALIIYADMDISIIEELPSGRQAIDTFYLNSKYRTRIISFIEKEVEKGRQAFIICPLVQESESLDLADVEKYKEEYLLNIKDEIRIKEVHGQMKAEEKNGIMERFANHEIDLLIASTIVEVGINVPNASLMIVENAERFGLSQLHQLRGRVGRGPNKSYCVLISDIQSEDAIKRLKTMEETEDGFELSKLDLDLRGPGNFFGTMQHGLNEINISNIYQSLDLFEKVNASIKYLQENEISKEDKLVIEKLIAARTSISL